MINHLAIQGRLVDTPVFGQTNNGTEYANFRLAWSKKYKDKETRCFLDCKAFSGTAAFMKNYMNAKGQEIIAEGELNTEEWEKDGQKRSKIALLVNGVHFCGKRDSSAPAESPAQAAPTQVDMGEGELPF
jgi:single-strand DNA-binding protein